MKYSLAFVIDLIQPSWLAWEAYGVALDYRHRSASCVISIASAGVPNGICTLVTNKAQK